MAVGAMGELDPSTRFRHDVDWFSAGDDGAALIPSRQDSSAWLVVSSIELAMKLELGNLWSSAP